MLDTLKDIISMYTDINPDEITYESDIRNDLDLNSLMLMHLVVEIEDHYNIEIPEDVAVEFESVGDVLKYLETVVE